MYRQLEIRTWRKGEVLRLDIEVWVLLIYPKGYESR